MRSDAEPELRAPAVSVPTKVGDCVLFSNLTYHVRARTTNHQTPQQFSLAGLKQRKQASASSVFF